MHTESIHPLYPPFQMATLSTFSSQTHNLKNQILGIQINKPRNTSSHWSWTRIFSPILDYSCSFSQISKLYCKIINTHLKNVLHVRRLTSFSSSPVLAFPYNHHHLCSSCHCFCLPFVSLHPLCRSCSSSLELLVMSFHSSSHGSNSNPTSQDSTKTVRCVIKGRVQGVFYRNWTVENATRLGLRGWVRNRKDGSVEALFSGNPEVVDEMMQRCRRGPPDAMVTAFQANPCNDDPGSGFERRPTV